MLFSEFSSFRCFYGLYFIVNFVLYLSCIVFFLCFFSFIVVVFIQLIVKMASIFVLIFLVYFFFNLFRLQLTIPKPEGRPQITWNTGKDFLNWIWPISIHRLGDFIKPPHQVTLYIYTQSKRIGVCQNLSSN